MKQRYQQLWALQQIDGELKTLTTRLESIPTRITELKKAAADLKAGLDSARAGIVEHRKLYKLAEVELKAAEEKINNYSVQLYSAKTNEQYKAFLKEIETQKKLKSGIEDRMIVVMEETEVLDRQAKTDEAKFGELDVDTSRKVGLLESEQVELQAAVDERRTLREKLIAELPADILKRYERIRQNKAGIAIATVQKERCSGCLSPIPAQRIVEIEREDRLYICEACGRIIITARN
ncbi:MAG: hypothetical protein R6X13_00375 [bacterium]